MAAFKYIAALLMLNIFLNVSLGQKQQGGPNVSQGGPHISQGGPNESQNGPHQNQGRTRRELPQDGHLTVQDSAAGQPNGQNPTNWTVCDMTQVSKISCHDCNTRLICKSIGGILKICNNPKRPYCNLGICSAIPNPNCL